MLQDNDKKVTVFPIPRCGSTSLRESFCNADNIPTDPSLIPDDHFTFTIVRDWRQRLVSALRGPLLSGEDHNKRLERLWSFDVIDSHVRPQHTFIPLDRVDLIIPIESVDKHWPRLMSERGFPELLKLNVQTEFRSNKVAEFIPWQKFKGVDWDYWKPFYEEDIQLCNV